MKTFVTAILIFFISATYSYAISYLGINGPVDAVGYYGVRSFGMGCTGIASGDDYSGIMGNPATLYNLKDVIAGIGIRMIHNSEHIMDFESSVYYDSSFSQIKFSTVYITGQAFDYLSFGISMSPVYDMNYSSEHYIPETSSAKYGVKSITSSGGINSYNGAISINIPDLFSIGFGMGILNGSKTLIQKISYDNNTYGTSSETTSELSYSGFRINFGAYVPITRQFSLGAKMDLGYDVTEKDDTSENVYSIPMSMGAGFVYKNFIRYDTQFAFDIIYTSWENYKVKYGTASAFVPNGVHNTVEYRMGVEHLVGKSKRTSIPVRLGYYYKPYPLNQAYDISAVTVGFGVPYWPLMMNVSMDYGKRQFRGDNSFFNVDKLVEETLVNVELTIDYMF